MEKLIEFRNLNFAYDSSNAFNDFNMEIQEGEIVTLIGTAGSGKTTLLKMLCNRLPNEWLYYKGKCIKEHNIDELINEIVVIFDTPIIMSTIRGEIERFVRKIGFSSEEIEVRIKELQKYFDIENLLGKNMNLLSKEEEALIGVLRYLIIFPKFLAVDNVLTALSKKDKKKFFEFVKDKKITLLNVTTNLEDSLFGSKLFVLDNFVLILEGSTLSVLKTDTLLKRLGFKLPLAVELSIELGNYEVIKKIYRNEEKLVDALWK